MKMMTQTTAAAAAAAVQTDRQLLLLLLLHGLCCAGEPRTAAAGRESPETRREFLLGETEWNSPSPSHPPSESVAPYSSDIIVGYVHREFSWPRGHTMATWPPPPSVIVTPR